MQKLYCYNFNTKTKFELENMMDYCRLVKQFTEIDDKDWPEDYKDRARKAYYQKVKYYLTNKKRHIDRDYNGDLILCVREEDLLDAQIKTCYNQPYFPKELK